MIAVLVGIAKGLEVKKFWVGVSNKGTRLRLDPAILSSINTNCVEIVEENGEIVLRPSDNGLKLELFFQRRWDGLPMYYYVRVPKKYRDKIKRLRKPYAVVESGKIVLKEKTEEEELREQFKHAVDRFFRVIDDVHYFEDKRREAEEKGLPHASIDFNLDLYRETLFLIATRDLSQFYDEIDPGAM